MGFEWDREKALTAHSGGAVREFHPSSLFNPVLTRITLGRSIVEGNLSTLEGPA